MSETNTEAQPVEGQDPAPAAPTAPPEQSQPAGGQGPWANDLATRFEDEAVRTQVDAFLREQIQPHVTRLEQEASKYEPAHRLYDDLSANPQETWIAVTRELYGDEAAAAMMEALTGEYDEPDDPTDEEGNLPPEYADTLEWAERQRMEQYYMGELQRVQAAAQQQGVEIDPSEFAPFVAASGGDFDAAAETYINYTKSVEQRITQKLGLAQTPEQVAAAEEAARQAAPPRALGQQGSSGAAPPVQEQYTSIEDALDATLAEMRANRQSPVTVGQV